MTHILPKLESGSIIPPGNFKLKEEIKSLDEFYLIITTERSIFARHRVYPCAFFLGWNIKLINHWLTNGWFWTINKNFNTIARPITDILNNVDSINDLQGLINLWNEIANNKKQYPLTQILSVNEKIRKRVFETYGDDLEKGKFYWHLLSQCNIKVK